MCCKLSANKALAAALRPQMLFAISQKGFFFHFPLVQPTHIVWQCISQCCFLEAQVFRAPFLPFPACIMFQLSSQMPLNPHKIFKFIFASLIHPSFHHDVNMVLNTSPCAPDPDFQVSNHCIFFVSFAALKQNPGPNALSSAFNSFFCFLPAGKNPRTVLMLYFQYQIHCYFRRELKSADLKQFKLDLFNC